MSKPIVFNYGDYEKVVEENKKLKAEVADLRIRIADGDKRDCKSCKHQKADGCSRWNCEYEPRMDGLISRQDAIDAIVNGQSKVAYHDASESVLYGSAFRQNEIIDILTSLPSADAVEVVRCKDCKNRNENCGMGEHRWCETINMSTRADDYCSYGERRES